MNSFESSDTPIEYNAPEIDESRPGGAAEVQQYASSWMHNDPDHLKEEADTGFIDRKRSYQQALEQRWQPPLYIRLGDPDNRMPYSQPVAEQDVVDEKGLQPEPAPWSKKLHRQFVKAIYDIGVGHASPSVIIENMTLPFPADDEESSKKQQQTSERVKSHLQKYRKNKQKSTEEFMGDYDQWLQKALSVVGGVDVAARTSIATNPALAINMMNEGKVDSGPKQTNSLLGGDVAAYLSFAIMVEDKTTNNARAKKPRGMSGSFYPIVNQDQVIAPTRPTISLPSGPFPSQKLLDLLSTGVRLEIPVLTEEERKSSFGIAMSNALDLFHSLKHHIIEQRTVRAEAEHSIQMLTQGQLDRSEPKHQLPVRIESNSEFNIWEENSIAESLRDSCSSIHEVLVPDPPVTGLFARSQVARSIANTELPGQDRSYRDANYQKHP